MTKNNISRRSLLQTTTTGILGIAGGLAVTGNTAAQSEEPSGEVTVSTSNGDWDYQIGIEDPYHQYEITKGNKADSNDEISNNGNDAVGIIEEGNDPEDNYHFPKTIVKINVSPIWWDSQVEVTVGSTWHKDYIVLDSFGHKCEYSFEYSGKNSSVSKGDAADGHDSTDWSSARGYLYEDGRDNYRVVGYLSKIRISDYGFDGLSGIEITFDAN